MYKKTNNKYDYLVIILISLLVFGDLGGSLQPIRIFSLLFLPTVIIGALNLIRYPLIKFSYRFVSILYFYICLSLIWTSDINEGLKEIVYYLSHFSLLILVPLFFLKANKPLASLLRGWVIFIFLTQVVAFNEIFFDVHLSTSFFSSDEMINAGGTIVQKKFASVTFGNYNAYSMIISMALPFLFAHLYVFKKLRTQIITIIIICFSYFILLINASRGGIIAGGIIFLVFLFITRKQKINHLKMKSLILLPIAFIFLFKYSAIVFEQVSYRLYSGASFTQDTGRFELFNYALQAFYRNPFFGSGVGSLKVEMQDAYLTTPHNLLLEFLVQFGLFATLLFLFFLFRVFAKSTKKYFVVQFVIYSSFFSLPIISIINSGYLLYPILWIYIASLYCFSFLELQDITLTTYNENAM